MSTVKARNRGRQRRAFALPLVILLALVATLAVAVLLERHGAAYAATERQVDLYRKHHRNMGVQEMIDRWLQTVRGPINERLRDEGLAFELVLPGSEVARVYMEDGQGSALAELAALRGPEAEYARRTAQVLRERFGPEGPPVEGPGSNLLRDVGPAQISAAGAPVEVLEALAQSVAPSARWDRFVNDLVQRRQDATPLQQSDIRSIALNNGFNQEETGAIEMMLTADPIIWRVVVETRVLGAGRRGSDRHGGLIEISREQVGMGQATRFLTWDDLPDR